MAAIRFPTRGLILLAIIVTCLGPLAEGTKESIAVRAEHSTQRRQTAKLASNEDYPDDIKKTHGQRIEPNYQRTHRDGFPLENIGVSRRNAVRRIKRPLKTPSKLSNGADDNRDSMLMADTGGKPEAEDSGNDEKKTLSQQVAEGKYGLIQELHPNAAQRPGVISYKSNPEVPKDTADNLGGLGEEDIWLAEDHVLVLAGGSFRDKESALEQTWPPIDNYVAPRRQVKIPDNPKIPPPFPVQLREGEPPRFIGGVPPPFPDYTDYPDQGNNPTGPFQPGPWAGNDSYTAEGPQRPDPRPTPLRPQAPGGPPPPYRPLPIPPKNGSTPPKIPPRNQTQPFDEDDPSFYYPPPYDFYYPSDNTTEVPPGPLVPGLVLPPPPDFFAPLNKTSHKEKRPLSTKKVQNVDNKTPVNTRQRYRPTTLPPIETPTVSTPGPAYLPVRIHTTTIKPIRGRPITKERPITPLKVEVQGNPNLGTTQPVEVIPGVTTFTSENEQIVVKPLDQTKLNNGRDKHPTVDKETLYYYNGQNTPQIGLTTTPRPIIVDELYHTFKNEYTSPKPLSPKKQVIYIFSAPEHQDLIANQVSSTEFPLSLHDSQQYKYTSEDSPRHQIDDPRYKSELPTPPRVENFHNIGSEDQYYEFQPSPIDSGSTGSIRVSEAPPNRVNSGANNNFRGDLNSNIQSLRQLRLENDEYSSKPVFYFTPTDQHANVFNGSQERENQAFEGQVPQWAYVRNYPSTYDSQPQPYYSNRGNDDATIVTPRPKSTLTKFGGQRIPPSRGNGGVSIITVKPSVLYQGPSAEGNQNHGGQNIDFGGNGFKPSTYYQTQGNNPPNPSVSIENPSSRNRERLRILQNTRLNVHPLIAQLSPTYFPSTDESRVIIGENNGNQKNLFPEIYYSSSTPTPPKLQNGNGYVYVSQPASGFVPSTPLYDNIQRAPKYISITAEDARITGRKKIPQPQYEEYFEANTNASPFFGQNNGKDQSVPNNVYIQSTTPTVTQTTSRPAFHRQIELNAHAHGEHTPRNIKSSQSQSPVYFSSVQQNENQNFYVQNTPSPPIPQSQYQPQLIVQKPSAEHGIFYQTTPTPFQYNHPTNKQQNIVVTTPAPNYAVLNLPSTTVSPLPSYLTTKDFGLFDDATKNYFTIFGQKIGNRENGYSQEQRFNPTTPLTPVVNDYDNSEGEPIEVTTIRPIKPSADRNVISLADDIRVNYRDPLPPINTNSEFITPLRNQPQPPRPLPAVQRGALVSYQLPGVDGQGIGGGSRYYFLTPHSVSNEPQRRPLQQGILNQQRPFYDNYWRGRRSS